MDKDKLKMAVDIIDDMYMDLTSANVFLFDPDEFSICLKTVKKLILESCEEGNTKNG